MSTSNTPHQWINASTSHPCEVCGKTDWCRYTDSGSIIDCYRSFDGNGGVRKVDRAGVTYHRVYRGPNAESTKASDPGDVDQNVGGVEHRHTRADADTLHAVYSDLLSNLKVRGSHEQRLVDKRGFTQVEVEHLGYRSFPTQGEWNDLSKILIPKYKALLIRVPGFSGHELVFADGSKKAEIRLDGDPNSLLVPIRDVEGRIVGCQIRHDMGGYSPLTGASSPRSCAAFLPPHVPLHDADADLSTVGLTEGTFKADFATLRLGYVTIGVQNATAYPKAADIVTTMNVTRIVFHADADARSKPHVAQGLATGLSTYASRGHQLALTRWDPKLGKGIDDVLKSNAKEVLERLEGADLWTYANDVLRTSKAGSRPEVDARLTLAKAAEKIGSEPLLAFRPEIQRALAELDTKTIEYQTVHTALTAKLTGKQRRDLSAAIASEVERIEQRDLVECAKEKQAKGEKILTLGDQVDVRDRVLADLTPKGGGFTSDPERLVYDLGSFFRYETDRWKSLEGHVVKNAITEYSGAAIASRKLIPLLIGASFVNGTIDLLTAKVAKPSFFNDAPSGIAFKNGFLTVDPKTGVRKREPHAREHRVRVLYDFDYVENAVPTRFLDFLHDLCRGKPQEETAAFVECILAFHGACITGLAPRFEKAIFSVGPGGTGNSTLRDILAGTMPAGSVVTVPPATMGNEQFRAALAGALLNSVDDLPQSEILDTGTFKTVVTGGSLVAKNVFEKPFNFRNISGQWYACNELPKTRDVTHGFARRIVILRFRNIVTNKNRSIASEIIEQEKAQIVSAALAALSRAIENNGLTVPASSDEEVAEWLGTNDTLRTFIEARLATLDPAVDKKTKAATWMSGKELYAEYKEWAAETGHKPFTSSTLLQKIKDRLQMTTKDLHTKQGNVYPFKFKDEVVVEKARRAAAKPSVDPDDDSDDAATISNVIRMAGRSA